MSGASDVDPGERAPDVAATTESESAETPRLEEKPKRRRRRGCLRVLLIALVVLGVPYIAYRVTVKALIRAELKAVSAAGYPATSYELNRWYTHVHGGGNAAFLFLAAAEEIPRPLQPLDVWPEGGSNTRAERRQGLTEEEKGLADVYLEIWPESPFRV